MSSFASLWICNLPYYFPHWDSVQCSLHWTLSHQEARVAQEEQAWTPLKVDAKGPLGYGWRCSLPPFPNLESSQSRTSGGAGIPHTWLVLLPWPSASSHFLLCCPGCHLFTGSGLGFFPPTPVPPWLHFLAFPWCLLLISSLLHPPHFYFVPPFLIVFSLSPYQPSSRASILIPSTCFPALFKVPPSPGSPSWLASTASFLLMLLAQNSLGHLRRPTQLARASVHKLHGSHNGPRMPERHAMSLLPG